MTNTPDIVVIGAGIAGASLAAELASTANVLLLEREVRPGMHSTGRSAAMFHLTYGGPRVQPLVTGERQSSTAGLAIPFGTLWVGLAAAAGVVVGVIARLIAKR